MIACALVEPPVGFIVEYTTTVTSEVVTFRATGTVNLTIDWGDGVTDIVTSINPTHTYTNTGLHTAIAVGVMGSFEVPIGDSITGIVDVSSITGTLGFFGTFQNSNSIINANIVGDSNIDDLEDMFEGATVSNSIVVDLPSSSATVATAGFENSTCPTISVLNLPNVTTAPALFRASTATSITVGDLPAAADLRFLCQNCLSLSSLTFTHDLPSVQTLDSLANNCPVITTADLSILTGPTLYILSSAFRGCSSLTSVIWPTTSPVLDNISLAMSFCTSLVTHDISGLDTSSVTNMSGLFKECTSLQSVTIGDTSSCTNFQDMFLDCDLLSFDATQLDTSAATSLVRMFKNNSSLSVDISSLNVSNVTAAVDILLGTSTSVADYDALLAAWSLQTLKPNVQMGHIPSQYTNQAARDILTNSPNNWVFTDNGVV